MSKIVMVIVAAVIALASAAVAGNVSDRGSASKFAQYCLPQDEIPGAQTVYC